MTERAMFPTPPWPVSDGRCQTSKVCAECRAVAEAWAWRCADTMPDSAQSRRDSLADADALGVAWGFSPWQYQTEADFDRNPTELAARAAFRAVPALREP